MQVFVENYCLVNNWNWWFLIPCNSVLVVSTSTSYAFFWIFRALVLYVPNLHHQSTQMRNSNPIRIRKNQILMILNLNPSFENLRVRVPLNQMNLRRTRRTRRMKKTWKQTIQTEKQILEHIILKEERERGRYSFHISRSPLLIFISSERIKRWSSE